MYSWGSFSTFRVLHLSPGGRRRPRGLPGEPGAGGRDSRDRAPRAGAAGQLALRITPPGSGRVLRLVEVYKELEINLARLAKLR
jgi:hypothetical protein